MTFNGRNLEFQLFLLHQVMRCHYCPCDTYRPIIYLHTFKRHSYKVTVTQLHSILK